MELITIQNEILTVVLKCTGAVLHSIQKDGLEYLWQNTHPDGWRRRDANLFPCVGRLNQGKYRYNGKEYPMTPHGFCQDAVFEVTEQTPTSVRFTLTENPDPRCEYPFRFAFHVEYALEENRIIKTCRVENRDEKVMYFGMGSHPAFQVPLAGEGEFTDWYFEFPEACTPNQITLDHSNWLLAEERPLYPLKDGTKVPLTHGLFDYDAIVLQNMPRSITLKSQKSQHSVTVNFPHMPFVGLWHNDHVEVPFVCVEPWLSLPSHSAYMEDLETQENLIHLPAGETYENIITITLK